MALQAPDLHKESHVRRRSRPSLFEAIVMNADEAERLWKTLWSIQETVEANEQKRAENDKAQLEALQALRDDLQAHKVDSNAKIAELALKIGGPAAVGAAGGSVVIAVLWSLVQMLFK